MQGSPLEGYGRALVIAVIIVGLLVWRSVALSIELARAGSSSAWAVPLGSAVALGTILVATHAVVRRGVRRVESDVHASVIALGRWNGMRFPFDVPQGSGAPLSRFVTLVDDQCGPALRLLADRGQTAPTVDLREATFEVGRASGLIPLPALLVQVGGGRSFEFLPSASGRAPLVPMSLRSITTLALRLSAGTR